MAEAAEDLIRGLKEDRLTSLQLYKLGLVLYSAPGSAAFEKTCQHLLSILPNDLFESLDEALLTIPFHDQDAIIPALQSVLALNKTVKSPPRKAPSADLIGHLVSSHQLHTDESNAKDLALDYVRLYLLRETNIETFLPILHQLQEEQSMWTNLVGKLNAADMDWRSTILHNFDVDQRDYLETLLRNNDQDTAFAQSSSIKTAVESVKPSSKPLNNKRAPKATPEQEISRRIEQVKAIVPDLGDGFIEAALAQYQGSVETTVSRMLEPVPTWPSFLQTMDRNLPRRAQKIFQEDDLETREIVKARIKADAQKEEKEALLLEVAMRHDEYADDYDDQYDDIDGAGNVDIQEDFEAVRTYNRVLRGVEAEQGYFDEIRNTNRDRQVSKQQGKSTTNSEEEESDKEDGQRKYRGPDKMRGGRIPGRGGGRGGRGRNAAPPEASQEPKTDTSKDAAGAGGKAKPNLKSKQRKLDKRRDQQKKAQSKRAG